MTKTASQDRSPGARKVRALMALRGINTQTLAESIGFGYGHVLNVISGNGKSWRVQAAINRYFRERIFTRPTRTHRNRPKN